MASAIDITVKVNGGLFKRNIPRSVRDALMQEAVTKVSQRWLRGGKGLGVQRNTLTERVHEGALEARVSSTLHSPRRTGAAMTRKKIGQARAMAPRVLRKAAERIVTEMGSG